MGSAGNAPIPRTRNGSACAARFATINGGYAPARLHKPPRLGRADAARPLAGGVLQRRGGREHAHYAAYAHAYADGGAHRNAYPFAYSLSCPHAHAHRDAYCYAHPHADAYPLSYPYAYAYAHPHADRDSDAYADPNGDADHHADADCDADHHAHADSNRDADDHADAYAGGVADAPSLRLFRLHRRRGHALVRAAP